MLSIVLALLAHHHQSPMRWDLETDDTVAKIGIVDNRPVVLALGSRGESSVWCENAAEPLMDHVFVGGVSVPTHWESARTAKGSGGVLRLSFRNANPPLLLTSVWRARRGRGPIEHWTEIVNEAKTPVAVPQMESLNLPGIKPRGTADVWWIRRGASNAMTQGGTFQTPVAAGMKLDLVSDHHNGSSPVPWCAVQVGKDRGLYVGWEFSGIGRVQARASSSSALDIRAGLMPDFKTDIEPGETLKYPAAFVGCYRGDIDEGSHHLHQFVLEKLRAKVRPGFPDPMTIVNLYLDGGSDTGKEADVIRCESLSHKLGFEAFMADAMWFPACGDWRWDPARFPRGAAPIEQKIHRDGMQFGLWCAWDNGGISTDPGALSVRGPVGHPDWFPRDLPANWQPGPFYGESACMGSPEAKAWSIAKTQQMVGDWKVDVLKTDVHPMINDCTRTDHRHHYGTDAGYWSALGVYEVWDKLLAKYPGVVLENCSGASHIKDFGVIQRCAYTTVTDTLSNLPDRAGIYDTAFMLPPSAILTYTYEREYNQPGDDPGPYLARSGMMSAWSMDPTNSGIWTPEEKASLAQCVRDYKSVVRPVLKNCKVHHVMPRPDGKHWDGMEFWNEGIGRGLYFVFRPDSSSERENLPVAGLRAEHQYRVSTLDGSILPFASSGADLMARGISFRLPAKYTCDVVLLEDASRGATGEAPSAVTSLRAVSSADYFGATTSLSWSGSARCYRVVVSKRADMSRPVLEQVVYLPSFKTQELPVGDDLYVRVDAVSMGGVTPSSVSRFTVPERKAWDGVWLSDLPWVSATIGVPEGPHRDKNHYGNLLAIAGNVYPKGIWTHSFDNGTPSDIVIDASGYGAFAAEVGLDDASGGGSVQFQVLIDGRVASETPVLHPHELRHLRVDLGGAKTVTLRVLNGGDGYNSDHAVWGLARLLKPGAVDPFKSD